MLTCPAGVFTLRPRSTPLLAFSGGSGITPVISVIKSALATTDRSVRLLYANRNRESVIFDRELDAVGRRRTRTGWRSCTTSTSSSGFVHSDVVTQFVNADVDADFYVCGPAPFMDVVEDALALLHVPSDQVFIERFAFAAQRSATNRRRRRRRRPPTATGDEDRRHRAGRTAHEVHYQAGETFLETARRAGSARRSRAKRGAARRAWRGSRWARQRCG